MTAAVLQALGGLGGVVDTRGARSLALEGPHVLWLVAQGELDLFAVDQAMEGRWHFLGRLDAGTLLLGPVHGPRHTLVARPLEGCVLHRIPLRELFFTPAHAAYYPGQHSALEAAFADGAGRSMRVLFAGDHFGDDTLTGLDMTWVQVPAGSLEYGAAYSLETSQDLFISSELWQRLVDQQTRSMLAVDRRIEELDTAHEARAAAGIKAGEAVRAQADRALLTSIHRSSRAQAEPGPADDDATLAACRLVGAACGVRVTAPPRGGGRDERVTPVERIALASRVRIRQVKLGGTWWRQDAGPLLGHRTTGTPVALLWRRGGYEAVDPASGRRTRIGPANAGHYEPQGVMFYRPLPDKPLSLLRLMRFGVRGTGRDLRGLALSGLVSVLLGTLIPIATGQVLGVYVPHAQSSLIVQVSLALVGATVVSAFFSLWENTSLLRLEGRIEATLQPAVWDRLLRLPTRFFAERSTGELASAAMGVSAIRGVLSGISSVAVQAGTVAAVNLVLLLWYSVPLALAALGMLAVIGAAFFGLGMWQLRWTRKLTVLDNKLNNRAFQTLRGLPKLRVAAAEDFAYAAWAGEFARSRELQRKVGRIRNLTTVLNAVYLPLCTLAMFALLAGPARGSMSASGFLTFNSAVTMVLTSVTQLTGAALSAAAVQPLFEQMRPVFQELPEVKEDNPAPGPLSGQIEVEHLTFRYAEDGPLVLDDVTFSVQPGEFVAVVGASGCGKSTLLRMLIGFERPIAGCVRYDGQDLAALDQAAVRRQFGVVLQNAQPFSGSILDCICGAEQYTPEEIAEAVEMAGLTQDISRMPMGLHTILSDGGGTVSGGQRQRLMIAQALIRRPKVLFFDEATSALDNETQRIVIDSTRKLNATRLVIAHRLSTILDADRVIVMDQGRIAQQGSPHELLADTGGLFHSLVRRQLR